MAFFDSNIQPDWVHIDHVDEYPVVYLPYPVMLNGSTVARLRAYVERGGTLISEGMPGYFGEGGRAGETQPHQGLDKLFGASEADVEFAPDLFDSLVWRFGSWNVGGRFFRQVYKPTTGKPVGSYADGSVAAVEHSWGKGKAILIGTFPAASYFRNQQAGTREMFKSLLGRPQRVMVSDGQVTARLHEGSGGTVLWVMNPARGSKTVTVTLAGGSFKQSRDLWGGVRAEVNGNRITVTLPERDAAVLKLE